VVVGRVVCVVRGRARWDPEPRGLELQGYQDPEMDDGGLLHDAIRCATFGRPGLWSADSSILGWLAVCLVPGTHVCSGVGDSDDIANTTSQSEKR
jgi:hypothetical protein